MAKAECLKCGFVWAPRKPKPKQCSRCKNPNWKKTLKQAKRWWER